MANKRMRFVSPTVYGGVSYAQNEVVALSDEDVRALGDTVEAADDVDVEDEAQKVADETTNPDTRTEAAMVTKQPDDAQDVPDALRDEQANLATEKKAKSLDAAPTNKMVKGSKDK